MKQGRADIIKSRKKEVRTDRRKKRKKEEEPKEERKNSTLKVNWRNEDFIPEGGAFYANEVIW